MSTVSPSSMQLKLWGVRGSIPVPGPATIGYGGNTSCVELRADGEIIVLDAGSGIRLLGQALEREFGDNPIKLSLLITHAHWDHIQGLPFFLPAYEETNSIRVYGYNGAQIGFAEILAEPMKVPFFPIKLRDVAGKIDITELENMQFKIGNVEVRSQFVNHPGVCVGYRLFTSAGSIAFVPDHEPYELLKLHSLGNDIMSEEETRAIAKEQRARLVTFLEGSDLLMLDAQYTDQEYPDYMGWGHGSLSTAVALALDAQVRRLLLFHHDPNHDDAMIDEMVKEARALVAKRGKSMEVAGAREGEEFSLDQK
jgi:phosphoribosyl 1,2-cyclic phosphodiesterase